MAKDILSIPASGVGVERLFNTARDVCHYRRNHLNANTIEIIMLVKWYEKLRFSASEQELSQNSGQEADTDEPPMDERASVEEDEDHYEIVWETDSEESDDN
jgi:hAT family C-terminal dimerisation region